MPEAIFEQHRSSASRLSYWEAGAGEPVVVILDGNGGPTRAHALLAEHRHVVVFAPAAGAEALDRAASGIANALAKLRISHFDVMGEGAGAAIALQLARLPEVEIGAIVLAAAAGPDDQAFRDVKPPVLLLSGTRDGSEAAGRYRALLPGAHFMLVYDAGSAIGIDRPQALAFIAREFFERRDLFLVSRESGVALP